MRILLINSAGADVTHGGAERYVRDLEAGLGRRGHEVELLSAFPVADHSAGRTHTLHRVDWRQSRQRRYRNHVGDWVAAAWPRFEEILLRLRPDLVHTSNLPGIGTGIWERARQLNIPVVHTLHDYHLLCPRTTLTRRDGEPCRPSPLLCGLRTHRLARWAPGVRVVIGVSEHVLRRHEHFFAQPTERLVVRAPLRPIAGAAARPPGEDLAAIGYLGVLTKSKGIDLLLEAAPHIAQMGVRLRVAGEGPLRGAVESAEHVSYEGRLGDAAREEFLLSCDAGVVPSTWEEPGLTYVLCEWLAAGRPVLATDRGGLAEAGALGGVMALEASASALIAGVSRVQQERVWRRLLQNVPTVQDATDLERWLDQHEHAYQAALSGAAILTRR